MAAILARAASRPVLAASKAPTEEEVGHADRVYTNEIADTKCIIINRNDDSGQLTTIIVRGATQNIIENAEKTVEEGVNAYKNLTRDNTYLPGAGAIEMYIANAIKEEAKKEANLDSYAIAKFGESFEVVPRSLSDNAGLNTNVLLALLNTENSKDSQKGINLLNGKIENAYSFGAFDHRETKKWAIKFSVDAILTVLRVDQIILSKPAGGPTFKKPPGYVNEEDEF
jgi:T-complex protein 1 subunit theta